MSALEPTTPSPQRARPSARRQGGRARTHQHCVAIGPAFPPSAAIGLAFPPCAAIGPAFPPCAVIGLAFPPCAAIGPAFPPCAVIGLAFPPCAAIGPAFPPCAAIGAPCGLVEGSARGGSADSEGSKDGGGSDTCGSRRGKPGAVAAGAGKSCPCCPRLSSPHRAAAESSPRTAGTRRDLRGAEEGPGQPGPGGAGAVPAAEAPLRPPPAAGPAAPRWRRRATPRPQPLAWSKLRPQSYQSPSGVLVTDFPVEDRCAFSVTQPTGTGTRPPGSPAMGSVSNGTVRPPGSPALSPERRSRLLVPAPDGPVGSTANGTISSPGSGQGRRPRPPGTAGLPALAPQQERIVFGASAQPAPCPRAAEPPEAPGGSPGPSRAAGPPEAPGGSPGPSRAAGPPEAPGGSPGPSRAAGPPEAPGGSPGSGPPAVPCAEPPALLSTHSPAARRVGSQQLIPRSLAESRPAGRAQGHERGLKVRSLVETPRLSLGSDPEDEPEGGPGALRRGLRSTSYRRAVVSGVDLDGSADCKKKNRMSQPILKAVVEDKEKFSSLGRIKKMLKGQGTFDGEENAVLYQNYKEKALDIDSDEESEPQEQKLDDKVVFPYKPLRSTWSQLSVVKKNGLSEAISQEERKRQEAIFEVISSEHSYLLSLEILIRMFKNSRELSLTMTKTESHHLFSNITDVYEASKKFFEELEARHQSSVFIDDISDIVARHAGCSFDPYVKYCTNEVYQQRTLQRLLATNPAFKEVLSRIESHEDCRNLPMISFLILPMQRVTRLPLLMDTICQKTPKDSAKYENCKQALKEVSKPFPLVSSSRWLVKRGELTAYVEDTGLFSKRTSKQQVYFFLFNDVLIITKKKSEESYNVTEYSLREQLLVLPCDGEEPSCSPRNAAGVLHSGRASASHLFRLLLLSNHAGDRVQMLLGAETQSDRARWITALGQDSDGQHTDRTSLAQVEIIRTYTAKQADELSLQVADVVLVYQKVNDGWYEGERLRDGQRGWFPSECAREITCRATLDKNMERMGRLLGLETNV
ncbi:rho guanine nucleotide exchange factor 26 [Onychostruthus taczanowskii]|uniref:rho guanine nucleotide exchange factor 26 n=1 Tax=Onychostruthus taczanowskii TaxID=356909 RepID=UPI001B8009D9|nr:rho guanine nucleotide exchange factor 26 [Onychostruthus taczanowskii]